MERLQESIKSDPKNLDAMRELIDVKMHLKEPQAAADIAEQAVRLTQHRSVRELMVLAQCHISLNSRTIAGDVIALAIQAAQNDGAEISRIKQWCQENAIKLSQ